MHIKANWFKEWFDSPYYHLLYFERDDYEAAGFINLLIDHLNPLPQSRMLDVACGRGRHSKILSARGYDITGIDLSTDSILQARKYETDQLHFYQHDMRLPFWMNYFDYAFNFFTSFGYFKTTRENDNAIRTIAHSLKPGGIFVMDYLNVPYVEQHLVHESDKEVRGVKFHLKRWQDETHFYKEIRIEDPGSTAPLTYVEKVAKFVQADFIKMFSSHNLKVHEVFGDYGLTSYDVEKSPRLIMIAKKFMETGEEGK